MFFNMYGSLLKIESNSCFENKTKKYLTPLLKCYSDKIKDFYFKLQKCAFAIDDVIAVKCGIRFNNCLFILVKIDNNINVFNSFLNNLKKEDFYQYDYCYENILLWKYHIIVVKIPNEYEQSYNYFKEGKYSKMFEKQDIKKFFVNKETINVLMKNKEYKKDFKKKIQKEFNYNDYIPDDICEEFDIPYSKKQEILNYNLN